MATPFDQRPDLIWFDGKLIPTIDCKISVLTHGLHYASAVFEGERAYGGEIFKCTAHSERLKNSARNCKCAFSLMRVDLITEKSAMLLRGPMMVLRPALPNVPAVAGVNAAVLNHASQRLGPLLGFPMALGRSLLDSPLPLGAAPTADTGR